MIYEEFELVGYQEPEPQYEILGTLTRYALIEFVLPYEMPLFSETLSEEDAAKQMMQSKFLRVNVLSNEKFASYIVTNGTKRVWEAVEPFPTGTRTVKLRDRYSELVAEREASNGDPTVGRSNGEASIWSQVLSE